MRWPEHATGWPLAEASRIVAHPPHRWHVQELGQGPTLLLLHGAGGATQSWRHLAPLLAREYHLICVDLPGQGFTQAGAQRRFGLNEMAEDLMALTDGQGWAPKAIIGHSAGAAIALRMVQLGQQTEQVIGLNAALSTFKGLAGWLFPAMAKTLAMTPFAASAFSATATAGSVARLLDSTGSQIDAEGQRLYLRLIKDRDHVSGTLSMMANWELERLLRSLDRITTPVHLITGAHDRTVPPRVSEEAAARLANATVRSLPGLGHLAHEEDAEAVADVVFDVLRNGPV